MWLWTDYFAADAPFQRFQYDQRYSTARAPDYQPGETPFREPRPLETSRLHVPGVPVNDAGATSTGTGRYILIN